MLMSFRVLKMIRTDCRFGGRSEAQWPLPIKQVSQECRCIRRTSAGRLKPLRAVLIYTDRRRKKEATKCLNCLLRLIDFSFHMKKNMKHIEKTTHILIKA